MPLWHEILFKGDLNCLTDCWKSGFKRRSTFVKNAYRCGMMRVV